jgi:hypothetical protein
MVVFMLPPNKLVYVLAFDFYVYIMGGDESKYMYKTHIPSDV